MLVAQQIHRLLRHFQRSAERVRHVLQLQLGYQSEWRQSAGESARICRIICCLFTLRSAFAATRGRLSVADDEQRRLERTEGNAVHRTRQPNCKQSIRRFGKLHPPNETVPHRPRPTFELIKLSERLINRAFINCRRCSRGADAKIKYHVLLRIVSTWRVDTLAPATIAAGCPLKIIIIERHRTRH